MVQIRKGGEELGGGGPTKNSEINKQGGGTVIWNWRVTVYGNESKYQTSPFSNILFTEYSHLTNYMVIIILYILLKKTKVE